MGWCGNMKDHRNKGRLGYRDEVGKCRGEKWPWLKERKVREKQELMNEGGKRKAEGVKVCFLAEDV